MTVDRPRAPGGGNAVSTGGDARAQDLVIT